MGSKEEEPQLTEKGNYGITDSTISITQEQLHEIVKGAIAGALQAHSASGTQPVPRDESLSKVGGLTKKPDRPTIDLGSSEGDWKFFVNEWTEYKERCKLQGREVILELKTCCSIVLRREIFDYLGCDELSNITEAEFLKHMKTLAVKGKNKSVHRKEFYTMEQSSGQSIQAFVTKLRSKASHCDFKVRCSNTNCGQLVCYAEEMISDQMVVGCADPDVQQEVLAKDIQLDNFQKKYDLILALEEGRIAKGQLENEQHTVHVAQMQSEYKKKKRDVFKSENNTNDNDKSHGSEKQFNSSLRRECFGCGFTDHGPGTNKPRNRFCPAWDKECKLCHGRGHYARVCKKFGKSTQNAYEEDLGSTPIVPEQEPSYFFTQGEKIFVNDLQLYNRSAWQSRTQPYAKTQFERKVIIPHVEWHGGAFVHCKPKPLPKLEVNVTVLTASHRHFNKAFSNHDLKNINNGALIACLTDTGAQTCASGPEILKQLNIHEKYLIPTSHRIVGVTQTMMNILGVLLVKIVVGDKFTCQAVYVSNNIKGFFLSEKAQIDLHIIPDSYPKPQEDKDTTATCAISKSTANTAACGCPKRCDPPRRPSEIPYPPVNENRELLEKWLLQFYAASAFNTCEHQTLPKMSGKPLDIHFRKDATPHAFHSPIPVPHHWKKQVKSDIDRDVNLGIIEPVPPGTPAIWCSKMVVVPKKDGSARRVVDLQYLNNATYRETHHTPSPFHQASVIPPYTKKTVLDAWNGYHSLQLSATARDATTFITEWGRYRYLSAPQGFHAAGDGYTRQFDNITIDFPRKAKCIDDSLLWDTSLEDAFWHTVDYIELCSRNGIIFNPKKFHFANDEVEFAGFVIKHDGIKPTEQMLSAIKDFPIPTSITDARSWFGLINQVAYSFALAEDMAPFRELLKPGKPWYWDDALTHLFVKSKEKIIQMVEKGVRNFEIDRPTCLATDWSKTGIGFVLLQKFCSCDMKLAPNCCKTGWQLIYAGSRFTTSAESRYAPVEGEALAAVYALEKCRIFILGCKNLTLVVDHKPLVKILGDRSLDEIKNPRLFNFKEKTLMYDFAIKHVPGKWHAGPDACSRYPSKETDSSVLSMFNVIRQQVSPSDINQSTNAYNYVQAAVVAAMSGGGYTDGIDIKVITWERVKYAAGKCSETTTLLDFIMNGFPENKSDLPPSIQPYWNIREDLSCLDGVALYNNRIVVPQPLRTEVLDCLHAAHQGTAGMKARARSSVFWPGINAAIGSRRSQCRKCNEISPSQPAEPMAPIPVPEFPFDKVVADYFQLGGIKYLVYADRYTGWIVVAKIAKGEADSTALKRHLRILFSTYGIPSELSTDGGPPFTSFEVKCFLDDWGVYSRLSSAYYAQSNGRAELAVKTTKRILYENVGANGDLNTDKVSRALLQYRNTPLRDIALSPSQLLYGRNLRDFLPSFSEAHKIRPEWLMVAEDRERALAKRNIMNMERYNEHTRELPELQVGDSVALQNQTGPRPNKWEKTGVIIEKLPNRQYTIRTDGSRRCTLRNRRFLKKINPVCSDRPLLKIDNAQPMNITDSSYETNDIQPAQLHDVHPNEDVNIPKGSSVEKEKAPSTTTVDGCPDKYDVEVTEVKEPRRSTRVRHARELFSAKMSGKAHDYVTVAPSTHENSGVSGVGKREM